MKTNYSLLKQYHYLYKITNLINNKIYIGIHSTDNLDDGYFGSGQALKRAIKKYGKENFKKEILEWFDWKCEALQREAEIVNEEFIKRTDVYNLMAGGKNPIYYSNAYIEKLKAPKTDLHKLNLRNSILGMKHTEETKRKLSNIGKSIKHTKEWNDKVSKSLFKRCSINGIKFESVKAASNYYTNIKYQDICFRLRSEKYKDWYYL